MQNEIKTTDRSRAARSPVRVNRKTYLRLAIVLGWCGGHRFYCKKYPTAVLCLLFFWTGMPLIHAFFDILVFLAQPADEEGYQLI